MFRMFQICFAAFLFSLTALPAQPEGYYRYPDIQGDLLVFAAEGDLWTVSTKGGVAHRLTTHPGEETHPVFSPDGKTVAYSATYEGPVQLYTIPLPGGLPTRWTYESDSSVPIGFKSEGTLIYSTRALSTLPNYQLVALNLETQQRSPIPLAQASDGSYDDSGKTLFFCRPDFHNNNTKRYQGGTARDIWKFREGDAEAVNLTGDFPGEDHSPMWWKSRIYYVNDRDGTMNLWSMNEAGKDLRQHTRHSGWDVKSPSLGGGRIAYQLGADIWIFNIESGKTARIPITLSTDLDQLREKWVQNPAEHLTSAHIDTKGERLVLTARGRVSVAPVRDGRMVRASVKEGVRYRDVVPMPDSPDLVGFSDESGELELVLLPTDGLGKETVLTSSGTTVRFRPYPSPNGKWVVYSDKNNDLWLLNVESKEEKKISTNREGIAGVAWAPDSRWLAFGQAALNSFRVIQIYNLETGQLTPLTSDRFNSSSAAWSPDGKQIYFISDRNLVSSVSSPWGPRQPEPFFRRPDRIYVVSLQKGTRSPFKESDELQGADSEQKKDNSSEPGNGEEKKKEDQPAVQVQIDLEGLQTRLKEVPVPPGDYSGLSVNKTHLFWTSRTSEGANLMTLKIENYKPQQKVVAEKISGFELSGDGKKMMVRKGADFCVVAADGKAPANLTEGKVSLEKWAFALDVREDFRQLFIDAWRLEREYFWDPGMHGLDWNAMRDKYLPLVDRVTTRDELNDLIGELVGELSALHVSVRGGDFRTGPDQIRVPSLGAYLVRDANAGGFRIQKIYQSDPDYPSELSPLADPDLGIQEGDVIQSINGVNTLSVVHPNALLRNQEGQQVMLSVQEANGSAPRNLIVVPTVDEASLRYRDWEYSRRVRTEEAGDGELGYVHLRAMGGDNITEWYRDFYPVFNRKGLIIDVRHNRGGNIDSFILEKLMRRAWFYWKNRAGESTWNMQYAFRGHMVVLCDEMTASDGEAFAEGFRRLGLGKVIGTRTWGGEIWLDSSNRLTDGGYARAPMMGVYGPEGKWLIEGHGVDPDVVVDNLPHATFNGKDAQLDAAIEYLKQQIEASPVDVPAAPPYPDKSFDYPESR